MFRIGWKDIGSEEEEEKEVDGRDDVEGGKFVDNFSKQFPPYGLFAKILEIE